MQFVFVTMATVGYGDITPTTLVELLVAVFIIAVGTSVFGYVIASISDLVVNGTDSMNGRTVRKLKEVRGYLVRCPPTTFPWRSLPPSAPSRHPLPLFLPLFSRHPHTLVRTGTTTCFVLPSHRALCSCPQHVQELPCKWYAVKVLMPCCRV